ncbi:general transcriptional corepressor trfA isoform X2 [Drosophila willistoni]|uniref:general transcriptional corepressor trfA isoform X2 n=1 Tax=Drosophila willistoni TaxID=7260 RepID=UPI000C26CF37|nr:general transcriptional corepressor trfA isoform X2 [Drosophila willistoni]
MDNFVKTLIEEVKSQGVFDEFRFNCCLADVDTKPAYQNVRNRVETAVNDFLDKQIWTPETNKVQLRERLRKHLLDTDLLDKGVDQIVDQVVNPKVATIFEPKIESIAYKYLGITPPPPPANAPPPRPPPLLPAPPLPPYAMGNGSGLLNVETTASLLPTDLEQISPDSDRATIKSDLKEDSKDELPPGVDDDDTSPSFEPLLDGKPVEAINGSLNTSDSRNKDLANDSRDAGASGHFYPNSQLSQVSSDSRLTIASSTDSAMEGSSQQPTPITPNMTANISEEAQMPKFSENSSEASEATSNDRRQLHFDINQDAIRFEGTERKNSLSENNNSQPQILSIEDEIMSEVKAVIDDANHAAIEPDVPTEPKAEKETSPPQTEVLKTPQMVDSIDTTTAEETSAVPSNQDGGDNNKEELPLESNQTKLEDVKDQEMPQPTIEAAELPSPEVPAIPKEEAVKSSESTSSPASSSSHSKRQHSKDKDKKKETDRRHHSHSSDKQRRKSRDRDRDSSRDKSHSKHSSSSSSKHSSSHSSSSTSKHKSSTSSSSKSSSNRSNRESSSSKRSSSSSTNVQRHESSSSSSQKDHKSKSSSTSSSSRSNRGREKDGSSHSHSRSHNGSSSSSSSKKSERDRDRERSHNKSSSLSSSSAPPPPPVVQDDHNEAKAKIQKRRSSDSNDEGKPPGSGGASTKSLVEDVASKETTSTTNPEAVQNGNGLNGNDGTNGKHVDANQSLDINNVVVVSDMLQQSTTSFIELNAPQKPEVKEKVDTKEAVERESSSLPAAEIIVSETTLLLEQPIKPENESNDLQQELKPEEPQKECNDQQLESTKQQIIDDQMHTSEHDLEQKEIISKEQQIEAEDQQTKAQEQDQKEDQQIVSEDQEMVSQEKQKEEEKQIIPEEQPMKTEEPLESLPKSDEPQESQPKSEEQPETHETKSEEQQIQPSDDRVELKLPEVDETVKPSNESTSEDVEKKPEVDSTETKPDNDQLEPQDDKTQQAENCNSTEETDDITHLEENADEFKPRLEVINQLIVDHQNLLNQLSADEPQVLADARALRRSTSKRRFSKEKTPTQQISPSGSSSSISSAGSSPVKTHPAKKLRRDEVKSSPTTSETSINSKENEALEKEVQAV